jgi:hypothetical protein
VGFIESIADRLQTQSLGTKGVNLFVGVLPETDSMATVLNEYDGEIIETNAVGIALFQPSLQVRVRGMPEDYSTPKTRIEAIQTALAALPDGTYTGVRILRVKPQGTILALGQDTNMRFEFTANFEVTYE